MAWGFVKVAVDGCACLILRFVSLQSAPGLSVLHSPVEIGCFNVAQPLGFTTAKQDHICGNKLVGVQPDKISNSYASPWPLVETLVHQNLGSVVVERFVRCVTFLAVQSSGWEMPFRTHNIFLDFFSGTGNEDHRQGHDSGIASCRRHIRNLLNASCKQKEQVCGSRKFGCSLGE